MDRTPKKDATSYDTAMDTTDDTSRQQKQDLMVTPTTPKSALYPDISPRDNGWNHCVPLKSPVPIRFQGNIEENKDAEVPDISHLVNYSAYDFVSQRRKGAANPPRCVMCGIIRPCTTGNKGRKSSGSNANPIIIPTQNKGLCTICDNLVWVITATGMQVKWCKGCKNFRPWAAFGFKGSATKCLKCRERQRDRYASQCKNSSVKKKKEPKQPSTPVDTDVARLEETLFGSQLSVAKGNIAALATPTTLDSVTSSPPTTSASSSRKKRQKSPLSTPTLKTPASLTTPDKKQQASAGKISSAKASPASTSKRTTTKKSPKKISPSSWTSPQQDVQSREAAATTDTTDTTNMKSPLKRKGKNSADGTPGLKKKRHLSPREKEALRLKEVEKQTLRELMTPLERRMFDAQDRHAAAFNKVEDCRRLLEDAQREYDEASAKKEEALHQLKRAAGDYANKFLEDYHHTPWVKNYYGMLQFISVYGNKITPPDSLRNWFTEQKSCRNLPIGHPDRLAPHEEWLIDRLAVDWQPDATPWSKMYDKLLNYRHVHGHAFVEEDDDEELFKWVEGYQNMETALTPEKKQKLEEAGVIWKERPMSGQTEVGDNSLEEYNELKDQAIWEERFQQLNNYKNVFGDCRVPFVFPSNPKLGIWVAKQRKEFQNFTNSRKSTLTQLRVDRLINLGFSFDISPKDKWLESYGALLAYKKEHGHCYVSPKYEGDLVFWIEEQRSFRRKMKNGEESPMTEEQVKLLDDIDFIWEPLSHAWDKRFKELVDFKAKHGHCLVPATQPSADDNNNMVLGLWVKHMRGEYKKMQEGKPSMLTAEQISALEEIGFTWKLHSLPWSERFDQLVRYKEKHGTANVKPPPKDSKEENCDHAELYRWVKRQRYQQCLLAKGERSKISPEQVKKMEDLGFVFNVGRGHSAAAKPQKETTEGEDKNEEQESLRRKVEGNYQHGMQSAQDTSNEEGFKGKDLAVGGADRESENGDEIKEEFSASVEV